MIFATNYGRSRTRHHAPNHLHHPSTTAHQFNRAQGGGPLTFYPGFLHQQLAQEEEGFEFKAGQGELRQQQEAGDTGADEEEDEELLYGEEEEDELDEEEGDMVMTHARQVGDRDEEDMEEEEGADRGAAR
jgi:hypothetical protein